MTTMPNAMTPSTATAPLTSSNVSDDMPGTYPGVTHRDSH